MTEQICECGHEKIDHKWGKCRVKLKEHFTGENGVYYPPKWCPCKKFKAKTGKYGDKGRPKNHSPQINGGNSLFTPEDTPSDNSGEPINSSEPEGTQNQEKEK